MRSSRRPFRALSAAFAEAKPRRHATGDAAETLERRTMLTTYTVDIGTDRVSDGDGSTDGRISLREAVVAATTNAAFGDAAAGTDRDTILFASGGRTVTLTSELLVDGGGGLTIDGSGGVTIRGDGTRLFRIERTDNAATVLRNLFLADGDAMGAGSSDVTVDGQAAGGLIAKLDTSTLLMRQVELRGGVAETGAAVYSSGGRVICRLCDAVLNQARGIDDPSDGGIVRIDGGTLISRSSAYRRGSGDLYGGVLINGAGLSSSRDLFGSNFADRGAGLAIIGEPPAGSRYEIRSAEFNLNRADEGGGLWFDPGTDAHLVVGSGTFTFNDADLAGGAIALRSGSAAIISTDFWENDTDGRGGAIAADDAPVTLRFSDFFDNTAAMSGGAIDAVGQVSAFGTTFDNNVASRGGGVAVEGTLLLRERSRLSDNVADAGDEPSLGGGAYVDGRLVIRDTSVSDNIAQGSDARGGGIYLTSVRDSPSLLRDAAIAGNLAGTGGGLAIDGATVRIEDSQIGGEEAFEQNLADTARGSGNGGGIASTGDSRVNVVGTVIRNNRADRSGGGVHLGADGFTSLSVTSGSELVANRATAETGVGTVRSLGGGGIAAMGGSVSIRDSLVDANRTAGIGGGVLADGTRVLIEESIVRRNVAVSGGGLATYDAATAIIGSGIRLNIAEIHGGAMLHGPGSETAIVRTLLFGNEAGGDGGGIRVRSEGLSLGETTFRENAAGRDGGGLLIDQGLVVEGLEDATYLDNAPNDFAFA